MTPAGGIMIASCYQKSNMPESLILPLLSSNLINIGDLTAED
jgi:hypothetical protein